MTAILAAILTMVSVGVVLASRKSWLYCPNLPMALLFAPETKVECDGYRSYLNLDGVQLEPTKYEVGDLHWLHKAISNLKTFFWELPWQMHQVTGIPGRILLPLQPPHDR